ncbi:MAG: rod shape-determining protein MreD [Acidobacteriota bacterium]
MSFLGVVSGLVIGLVAQVLLGRLWSHVHQYLNPLTLVVIILALRGSPTAGMLSGSIAGFMQDAFSAQVLGVSSVGKTLVGYAVGAVNARFIVRSTVFLVPLIFFASAVEVAISILLDRILEISPVLYPRSILTVSAGNALAGTVFIKITERFKNRRNSAASIARLGERTSI